MGVFEVIVSGVDDGWKEGENSVSNMGLVLVHSRAVSLILLPRELWFLFGVLFSSSGRGNGRAGLRGRLCFSFCLFVPLPHSLRSFALPPWWAELHIMRA